MSCIGAQSLPSSGAEPIALPSKKAAGGFTLIEIIVALIIFAISFGAIADLLQTSLGHSARTRTLLNANALAEQQLMRFGRDLPLTTGDVSGQTAEGLAWNAEIHLATPAQEGSDIGLYRIIVDVAERGSVEPLVRLHTLRVGRL